MIYPLWSYFPRNVRLPTWTSSFVDVVKSAEGKVATVERKTGLSSDAVLSELAPGLVALGYEVESGKTKAAKIHRPVLFGENGSPAVNYEIDAFHDELGVAVEVEAGRGAAGNADYRDIVRISRPGGMRAAGDGCGGPSRSAGVQRVGCTVGCTSQADRPSSLRMVTAVTS